VARVLAGPWIGQTLADLGADVIKIESPEGDDTRKWGPPWIEHDGDRSAAYYHSCNRGKRSIALDFTRTADRDLVLELADGADVDFGQLARRAGQRSDRARLSDELPDGGGLSVDRVRALGGCGQGHRRAAGLAHGRLDDSGLAQITRFSGDQHRSSKHHRYSVRTEAHSTKPVEPTARALADGCGAARPASRRPAARLRRCSSSICILYCY